MPSYLIIKSLYYTLLPKNVLSCHCKVTSPPPFPRQRKKKSPSPPPISYITCNSPSPKSIYILSTIPEPGSPSVGSLLWCQDESGSSSSPSDPSWEIAKCKMFKCPVTHCASCVLKCCLTMCQWNLFLNPGVDIEQIGELFNWQGGGG